MQMDLWVVAAATGAGYLAKYWKNVLGDKEGSSGGPSENLVSDNLESPSLIQHTGEKPSSSRKSSGIDIVDQCFSGRKGSHSDGMLSRRGDPFATDVASTSALNRGDRNEEFDEYKDGYRLETEIPDIPEYNIWEMGASHSPRTSRRCLRSRHLSRVPLRYIKPRTSLDSCVMAQMHREHSEMEEYLRTPLSSPCARTLRPFLVTNGRQVISRARGDLRQDLHKEFRPKAEDDVVGVPHLPKIITSGDSKRKLSKGKNRKGTSEITSKSNESVTRGSSSGQVLFCLGISIGVMSAIVANKAEVENLKESLKQSENLVEDLQEELEMKDSLTVKELANDDDSQDIHETSCIHEKMSLFSNQSNADGLIRYVDEESVSLEKIQSMSKIEAELEAELERLELSMTGSALQRKPSDAIEFEQVFDDSSEVVHGELNTDIFRGESSSEPTPDRGSTPQAVKEGISPRELSLRLHEVIQTRLQERIMELEAELARSHKRIQHLESQKNSWREVSQSESSSTLGSPMAQTVVMNLSGDALDAYNEVYGELNKLSGSQNGDFIIQSNMKQDELLPKNPDLDDELNGFENDRNRIPLKDVGPNELNGFENDGNRIPPKDDSPNDYDNRDDDDDDLLLIQQIVEKARQGSPAIVRAQKAMVWLNMNEN